MHNKLATLLTETRATRRPMELQLFADGDGKDGSGGDGGDNGGDDDGDETPPSFDDVLARGYQSEFDRRTQKAINTALEKERKKNQAMMDETLSEAERLKNLNAQERAEYERDKALKELEALKRKDTLVGMTKTAREMLAEEQITIPDALVETLVTDDADTTKSNVAAFAKTFADAVDKAVKVALKGETPAGGSGASKITKEQIFAIKDTNERLKAIEENKHLFQN